MSNSYRFTATCLERARHCFSRDGSGAVAHDAGAIMVVDGCQGVVHMPVDVQALGCDFYVFSGHKLYGPGGIGVLWGRMDI